MPESTLMQSFRGMNENQLCLITSGFFDALKYADWQSRNAMGEETDDWLAMKETCKQMLKMLIIASRENPDIATEPICISPEILDRELFDFLDTHGCTSAREPSCLQPVINELDAELSDLNK